MNDSLKKTKPTLESLLQDNQVITGKTLLKQAEDKKKAEELFQEALEFEERHRRNRKNNEY